MNFKIQIDSLCLQPPQPFDLLSDDLPTISAMYAPNLAVWIDTVFSPSYLSHLLSISCLSSPLSPLIRGQLPQNPLCSFLRLTVSFHSLCSLKDISPEMSTTPHFFTPASIFPSILITKFCDSSPSFPSPSFKMAYKPRILTAPWSHFFLKKKENDPTVPVHCPLSLPLPFKSTPIRCSSHLIPTPKPVLTKLSDCQSGIPNDFEKLKYNS